MKVAELRPRPIECEPFRRDRQVYVPAGSGCYVLANVVGVVLYCGLATNLRTRMGQHLDNSDKTGLTVQGRAVQFFWLETTDRESVERGWLNAHQTAVGSLPVLNKMNSPVSG